MVRQKAANRAPRSQKVAEKNSTARRSTSLPAATTPVWETIAPVRDGKTAGVVAGQIRKAIIRGQLKSGDFLPAEAVLIGQFGVSRPTVREAIRILESEGLLVVLRGAKGGARVLQPSWNLVSRAAGITLQSQGATLADVYDMRVLLEPAAARRAAEFRREEAAAALQQKLDSEYFVSGSWQDLGFAVAEFHRAILEQSGSPTLTLIGVALNSVVAQHQALIRQKKTQDEPELKTSRARAGLRSHQKLVDLIRSGMSAEAERHWRQHMEAVRGFWLEGIEETTVVDLLE
jgi:DNA-binding FadR family transcriptional regulator